MAATLTFLQNLRIILKRPKKHATEVRFTLVAPRLGVSFLTEESVLSLDIGQLRYGMRSVMRYAPWIRQIFLVVSHCASQTPFWLNISDPYITIVEHRGIWEDPSKLPSFNSDAIEANLHRIPGVAESFLYFNDDIALTKPLEPFKHLWSAPGVPILYQAWPAPVSMRKVQDHYGKSLVHVQNLFNARYVNRGSFQSSEHLESLRKKRPGKVKKYDRRKKHGPQRKAAAHTPFLMNTTIVKQLQADWKSDYDKMLSSCRFRCDFDMQTQFAYQQYILSKKDENGNAVFPYNVARDNVLHFMDVKDEGNSVMFTTVTRKPKQFLCLQDNMNNPADTELAKVEKFYESLFPTKASWEL